jgi:hypothetical protein
MELFMELSGLELAVDAFHRLLAGSAGLEDRLGMACKERRVRHRIRLTRLSELLAFECVVGVPVGELFAEARAH